MIFHTKKPMFRAKQHASMTIILEIIPILFILGLIRRPCWICTVIQWSNCPNNVIRWFIILKNLCLDAKIKSIWQILIELWDFFRFLYGAAAILDFKKLWETKCCKIYIKSICIPIQTHIIWKNGCTLLPPSVKVPLDFKYIIYGWNSSFFILG